MDDRLTTDFVGRGWAFPVRTGPTGTFALAGGGSDVEQAIEIILRTTPGERPMRPEFGCRINDHVFAPATSGTAAAIARDVRTALEDWEPRIDVDDIRVDFDAADMGTFYIDVCYRIHGRNDRRNLVFPFYVIPDEPDETGAPGVPAAPNTLGEP
ncbi:GPW/gp25 family protein [Gordonia sp. PKS22-38]|uniref:GPW/gp25 family protein n=1 Tax=Gordonia prachuapensis TaxID=3115651 RepID=A0ABU7MR04_9ACTN|nr:GPW/gp25 family protein [Gordonia sp. PKS22-38]